MTVHRPHYEGIPPDRDIIFLCSGGRDSTAMVLEAFRLGIKGTLLFGYTKFNKAGICSVERLSYYTGFPLVIAEYQGFERPIDILNESFRNIPKTIERIKKTGSFQRNYFYCCKKLKHGPMNEYIKRIESIPIIQVMGIKKTDGNPHRRKRLGELRNKNQYFRLMANGMLFWYPLRDCKDSDIDMILDEHHFSNTNHSGCSLCPILPLFKGQEKKDPEAYRRSLNKALQMGVLNRENYDLRVFCED